MYLIFFLIILPYFFCFFCPKIIRHIHPVRNFWYNIFTGKYNHWSMKFSKSIVNQAGRRRSLISLHHRDEPDDLPTFSSAATVRLMLVSGAFYIPTIELFFLPLLLQLLILDIALTKTVIHEIMFSCR